MATRRHDPNRKDRIVDAAIGVIAEHGVAGTTHRLIAAAADVPLGSLTYHFSSLEDLRAQAFQRHAERMSVVYESHFLHVHTHEALVDAITDLIHGDAGADTADWAIAYELYLAALRDPRCAPSPRPGCAPAAPSSNASSTRPPLGASTP